MAEPHPGGTLWIPARGVNVDAISRLYSRLYHTELAGTIQMVSERLEVYLTTVQLTKVQLNSKGFDEHKEGAALESSFLEETMKYVDGVYEHIYGLGQAQDELGTMEEEATEGREELPPSRTTRAHLAHSSSRVLEWLIYWWRPVLARSSTDDQRDDGAQTIEGEPRTSEGGGGGGGGGGGDDGGDGQLDAGEAGGGVDTPVDEAAEGGNRGNGSRGSGDHDGNNNSNGEETGNENGDSNGDSNGNGNGSSQSQDSSITKYKPRSGHRRVVTGESFARLLNEVWRQHGILRRVLLRHVHRLWFLTRVRQLREGYSGLPELKTTLDSIELEMVEAQLEVTRRAHVVRQLDDVVSPPRPAQLPPSPPQEERPQEERPPEAQLVAHHPEDLLAPATFGQLLQRVWHSFLACLPQRRN